MSALVSPRTPVEPGLRWWWQLEGLGHVIRARLRLISALVLLTFVVCHLTSHIFLLVSIPLASGILGILMTFWWTEIGGILLATALLLHFFNALWSIYVRRSLRLSRWEWAQLGLGLAIIPLMVGHVVGTRIAAEFLGVSETYYSVLVLHWVVRPEYPLLHIAAVLTVWVHASIGIHFWLHTKRWYPAWRAPLAVIALLIPTLAIAGYVAAGNHIVREAEKPGFVAATLRAANITPAETAEARADRTADHARLFRLAAVAIRRPRRSRLDLSAASTPDADSLEWQAHAHPTRCHRARDIARQPHSACIRLRWPRPLHHLPNSGDGGTRGAAAADRARS